MNLDIKRAFLTPFTGEKWLQKLLIGYVLSSSYLLTAYLPNPFLKYIFGTIFIFLWFCAYGYIVQSSHNELKNDSLVQISLPEWRSNFLIYLKRGTRCYLIDLIYIIAAIILILLFFLLLLFSGFRDFENFFFGKLDKIYIAGFNGIFLSIIMPLTGVMYAKNFKFKDGLKIFRVIKLLPNHFTPFIICSILSCILGFTPLILEYIKIPEYIMSFLGFPVNLMIFNLFAQFYRDLSNNQTEL